MGSYVTPDAESLSALAERVAKAVVDRTFGPVLARVVAYTQATERADLQPVVGVMREGVLVPAPIMRSVPIAFPRWATGAITWPLVAGDLVQVVPQDVDQSLYLQAGTVGQPAPTARRSTTTDVVGIPVSVRPMATPPAASSYSPHGPVIDGTAVYLGPSTATDMVALASLVTGELDKLWTAISTATAPPGGGTLSFPSPYIKGPIRSLKVYCI